MIDLSSPSIPPSKRSRVRQSEDEDPAPTVITMDIADAYMQSSVPVFTEDGHFRTLGPAPRQSQVDTTAPQANVVPDVA